MSRVLLGIALLSVSAFAQYPSATSYYNSNNGFRSSYDPWGSYARSYGRTAADGNYWNRGRYDLTPGGYERSAHQYYRGSQYYYGGSTGTYYPGYQSSYHRRH